MKAKVQLGNHICIFKSVKKCEEMSPHTPKWVPILGIGISKDSQIFKEQFGGQNSLNWRFLYTFGNLLKRRCLKWAHMIHLNIYNISYGWKKHKLCACKGCATYCWKTFDEGYNCALNIPSIKGLQKNIGIQNGESPNFEIFETDNLRVPRKMTFGCRPWPVTKNIIKGKVVASPKFKQWWILWVHAPKVLQLCTNQIVVWFMHVHMNKWPTCHLS
jgi:hypothetical protein